jgi:hypothetical protein
VARTDQTVPFFAIGTIDSTLPLRESIEKNENLTKLRNILLTFASSLNFETGYVQGMNDLASPILETIGNEAISFWAFQGFMVRMVSEFDVGTKLSQEPTWHAEPTQKPRTVIKSA